MTGTDEETRALASPLDVRREGRIVWLTLNRPESGNALDQPMAEALVDAARGIRASDEPCVVVIRATGRLFCAGGDVAAIAAAPDQGAYISTLAATVHDALLELRAADAVVVAAVQGAAAGGGLGVVLNADLVVASSGARFLSAYAAVGLSPDCGVSWLLPAIVGPRRAMELTLTARVLDASEAQEWGIVTAVTAEDDLDEHVQALAESLAAGSIAARTDTRNLINRPRQDYREHLSGEVDGLARRIRTDETRQRIAAFAARQNEKETAR
ncbi:hypothetical protein ASD65_09730 [Microbacterium sp. Root61]|uniref:enoyl-CoA hydratase/isomerase family protein n=1 Tax=Microbacterium sp. Root61 TaxID=1736570 RepID=UPI0006F53BC3|nr:enoyl-CoA hydratase-related protein [Microbacterium sp. Root61]KRA24659.1 hypothetical protein ASD65_09730 [Microbacterium sp. Root61]